MDNASIVSDPGSSHYLPGHNKPYDPRVAADAQESMKAKVITIRKKLVEQVRRSTCITARIVRKPQSAVGQVAKSF